MDLKRLKKSFSDAWHGVAYVYKNEQNFKIQIFSSIVVFIMMFVFELSKGEMIVILLLILLILILELLNSALEKFLDILKPRLQIHVALVKDIMAAMVLLASIGSVILGGMIFLPHIISIF